MNMNMLDKLVVKCANMYRTRYFKKEQESIFNYKPELKTMLAKNKDLKDAYKGKRCFVLGNGPSLKNIDLSILSDEYTFTVNQIARREDFPALHTNFHFWADPQFFNISPNKEEDLELLEIMKSVDTSDNHPKVFFPSDRIDFTKEFNLDDCLDCNFFAFRDTNSNTLLNDFSSIVSGFHTVVQYCILLATYMGFSEIYLYGCENTSIVSMIQAELNEDTQEYGYQISENEQKRMKNAHKNVSMTDCASSFYRTLIDYERLNNYCESNGIKLINCTPKSIIDSVQKMSLNNVLNQKQGE